MKFSASDPCSIFFSASLKALPIRSAFVHIPFKNQVFLALIFNFLYDVFHITAAVPAAISEEIL